MRRRESVWIFSRIERIVGGVGMWYVFLYFFLSNPSCPHPHFPYQRTKAKPPQCPSGSVCKSGICSSPTCDTSTCGTLNGCQPGCFCFSDTSGLGFCGPNTACEPLVSGCKDNNECGDGEVCAVGTCCGHNVCLGACDREKMRREAQEMEERGLMANGTTAVGMFTGGAPVGQLW